MTTKYQHRITIACPESLIPAANQLALIVGESFEDDKTFGAVIYQDGSGNRFAICSTVATADFLQLPVVGLPDNPSYAEDADRVAAQEALDTLTLWVVPEDPETPPPLITGLMMAVDIDPHACMRQWGLTRIEAAE